jgi:DNA-binding response OmpR family regulator
MKVLVATVDSSLVDVLSFCLKSQGHDVVRAFDGIQMMKRWREALPDLVILDTQLPRLNRLEVWLQLWSEAQAVALILLGNKSEPDEIRWLELGADDYVPKPLSAKLLLARITALMRRSARSRQEAASPAYTVGSITFDAGRQEVLRDGSKVNLTPTEGRLLYLLIRHAGHVLTTGMICQRLWRDERAANADLIKVHISHLRQKVEPDGKRPRYIRTVPGKGYTFSTPGLIGNEPELETVKSFV